MRVICVVLALGASGCIAGRGGVAVLPARYDLGAYASEHGTGGFHGAAGLHWASVSSNPRTPVDVGVGWMLERGPSEEQETDGAVPGTNARVLVPPRSERGATVHGPYLELADRISGSRHRRAFVGGRAELLFQDVNGESRTGVGLSARISWELFATTREKSRGAVASGAGAVGMFFEIGHRQLAGLTENVAVVGMTFRLPGVVAGNGCH